MKRLMLTIAFTCVLSVSALAGETSTPPGETQTPPGQSTPAPGETQGPNLMETLILTIITWR
jgi:hypothetical protein